MARYIDLDKCGQYRTNHGGYPDTFAFPPWAEFEDVSPVIHAHWIEEEDCTAVTDIPWSMCSACGSYSLKLPYCAFCGAKMDEEVPE